MVLATTNSFVLDKNAIHKVKKVFADEMDEGTRPVPVGGKNKSCLQMECTFVIELPKGIESGDFLSIDIGSTNFRVLLSRLNANGEDEFAVKYYDVPQEIRVGDSVYLFDHLAACIADFVSERIELLGNRVPLGFTFSYPCLQRAIDTAWLVTWTKSYDCPDAIGKDATTLLREAIDRRGDLNIDVVAILNDTTGTLVKGAYLKQDCAIAMILGSGFNAAYIEKTERLKQKLDAEQIANLGDATEVVVDIECGAFGDNGCVDFIKNDIDREIDQESLFVNSFSFEKMFAGNFLGDVTRRIFLTLTKQGVLFEGVVMIGLKTKDAFRAANAVQIEEAKTDKDVKDVLKVLGYSEDDISADDIAVLRHVVQIVANRGAVLTSILVAVILERIAKESVTVAFDGSLYKYHPRMKKLIEDYVKVLAPGCKFELILAEGGSGKGAGLVAAVMDKKKRDNKA